MGAVAAGLVIATALKLVGPLARNPLGRGAALLFVAGTALAIGVLRWPMVAVVLGFGSVAVALAWARLGR
jgi:chromate transporter